MAVPWHSVEVMRTLLERERARADRSGRAFCVLTFSAVNGVGLNLDAFDAIFRHRLRCTDDVGWMASQVLGVVLPDTEPSGAECLVSAIMSEYPQAQTPVQHDLYCYPTAQAGRDTAEADARSRARPRALEPMFVVALPRWKRAVDIAGAALGLVVTSPILACCVVLIKIGSPGPVLFRQQRAGAGGRPFTMLKLRTMRCDAEERSRPVPGAGPPPKAPDDSRVTSVGRWLRRWSLDELPQFWNVIRGDMSLVGPRPLPIEESDACRSWQRRRLDFMPGITCTWQVSGRNTIPFVDWVRMDLRYGRRPSWLADLKIILRTLPAVLSGKGAF